MVVKRKTKLELFFSHYRQVTYKKGQVLLLAGENPSYVYYVISGRAKQYDISPQGKEIILNIFKPGTYMLAFTALTNLPNSFYFSGQTNITLYRVPVADLLRFLSNNPEGLKEVLTQAYLGFEGALHRMTHLIGSNTRGRVIYEILLDARGFGEGQQVYPYTLLITEAELASRAGLSRETVSREISYLRKSGLLIAPKITITNPSLLEEALEQSAS